MKIFLKAWLVPILISIGLFVMVRPTFAQIVEGQQISLSDFLKDNDVKVGEEEMNGGLQIYYIYNSEKVFITDDNSVNRLPDSSGEYIAFVKDINGAGQIFRYHIPTGASLRLTSSSTNILPKVSKDGKVVWQRWVDDKYQIYLYDGVSIKQITEGDVSVNADIEGDFITYGRQDITGTWRSVVYSISKKEAREVTTGISSKKPKVRNGKIILAGTGVEKEFPLTVEDIFLLDLTPLTATASATPLPTPTPDQPETATVEDVIEELEATSSAAIEESTPSANIE